MGEIDLRIIGEQLVRLIGEVGEMRAGQAALSSELAKMRVAQAALASELKMTKEGVEDISERLRTIEGRLGTIDSRLALPGKADELLFDGDVEIFSNPSDDPPKAAAGAETATTIGGRVPISLKQRVKRCADKEGVSANFWVIRCLEEATSRIAQCDDLDD